MNERYRRAMADQQRYLDATRKKVSTRPVPLPKNTRASDNWRKAAQVIGSAGISGGRKRTATSALPARKTNMPIHAVPQYLSAIYNPENPRNYGAFIPDNFVIPSQKLTVNARFNGQCGGVTDNAFGYVALNPHFLIANDSDCIQVTGSTYPSLEIHASRVETGLTMRNSNSVYTVADMRRSSSSALTADTSSMGKRFRLVACKMRVTSQASVTAAPGEMVGLVSPLHDSVVGLRFEDLTKFTNHARVPGLQGNVIEVVYTPVWNTEYEYHNVLSTTEESDAQLACVFAIDPSSMGTNRGTTYAQYSYPSPGVTNLCSAVHPFMVVAFGGAEEIPFQVEIDALFEVIGLNIGQLASASPSIPEALVKAKAVQSIVPEAGASRANEPTFFSRVAANLPGLLSEGLSLATNLFSGNLLGAGSALGSLVGKLFG